MVGDILEVAHTQRVVADGQIDCSRSLAQEMNTSIFNDERIVDPQSAAVIGVGVEGICSCSRDIDESFIHESVVLVLDFGNQ